MIDAFRMIVLALALYALPLLFGRQALVIGCILWPIAFLAMIVGVLDVLVELSA